MERFFHGQVRSKINLEKFKIAMDYLQILGLAAAALTTVANVPQAIKMIRTKSTKSISVVAYSILFTGLLLWLAYGIMKNDLPIILANAASALVAGIILTMKIIGKKEAEAEQEIEH